ncbi:hypothetical protein ACFE04_012998 [Oxalis oulophora]
MPTKCNIYNATGYPLKFRRNFDISGTLSNDAKAPQEISNGKWGKFTHGNDTTKKSLASVGCIVYSGTTPAGESFECLVAWFNPEDTVLFSNKAYTEIRQYGGFDDADWVDIQQTLVNGSNSHGDHHSGCWSIASITKSDPSNGAAEELDAIITSPKK